MLFASPLSGHNGRCMYVYKTCVCIIYHLIGYEKKPSIYHEVFTYRISSRGLTEIFHSSLRHCRHFPAMFLTRLGVVKIFFFSCLSRSFTPVGVAEFINPSFARTLFGLHNESFHEQLANANSMFGSNSEQYTVPLLMSLLK